MKLPITKTLSIAALLALSCTAAAVPAQAGERVHSSSLSAMATSQTSNDSVGTSYYGVKYTPDGATISGKLKGVNKKTAVLFRVSVSQFAGQRGFTEKAYSDKNGNFTVKISGIKNTKDRYWQIETPNSGKLYGKVLAKGKVTAPKPSTGTTPPINAPKPAQPAPAPVKPTPAPSPTPAPAPAPTTSTPGPGTIVKKGFITGYTIHDNDPAGSKEIAYSKDWNNATIHTEAGGAGTYDDPITLAAQEGDYAPGTRFYLPHVDRYFMLEDTCANCGDKAEWIDMWIGGEMSDSAAATDACARALTGDIEFWVNPQRGLPVSTGPLFNSQTDKCYVPTP
jgi:hypothetical protein